MIWPKRRNDRVWRSRQSLCFPWMIAGTEAERLMLPSRHEIWILELRTGSQCCVFLHRWCWCSVRLLRAMMFKNEQTDRTWMFCQIRWGRAPNRIEVVVSCRTEWNSEQLSAKQEGGPAPGGCRPPGSVMTPEIGHGSCGSKASPTNRRMTDSLFLISLANSQTVDRCDFIHKKSRIKRLFFVGHTGFEPVTSAMSRRHSEPTELMTLWKSKNNTFTPTPKIYHNIK